MTEDVELAEVSVRDTGPGISPKVLRNLFVPFFTTKTEGTGLGLAISHSIVQNAGGTIEVQSQPGAGTSLHHRAFPTSGDASDDVRAVCRRPRCPPRAWKAPFPTPDALETLHP